MGARAARPQKARTPLLRLSIAGMCCARSGSAGGPPAKDLGASADYKKTYIGQMVLNHICANNAEGQRVLRGRSGKQRQGWRSAGVEPWMGSSTDEHRPRSTMRTTLNYSTLNISRCAQVFCGRAARAPSSQTPAPNSQLKHDKKL